MHKKIFLFLLAFQSIVLFSASPDTIKIHFPETMKSIDAQIHSNNLGSLHAVPLSGLGVSLATALMTGSRLENGDYTGAGIMGFITIIALAISGIMYTEDKRIQQEQLEQNEKLIKKKIELEISLQKKQTTLVKS